MWLILRMNKASKCSRAHVVMMSVSAQCARMHFIGTTWIHNRARNLMKICYLNISGILEFIAVTGASQNHRSNFSNRILALLLPSLARSTMYKYSGKLKENRQNITRVVVRPPSSLLQVNICFFFSNIYIFSQYFLESLHRTV